MTIYSIKGRGGFGTYNLQIKPKEKILYMILSKRRRKKKKIISREKAVEGYDSKDYESCGS